VLDRDELSDIDNFALFVNGNVSIKKQFAWVLEARDP